eukprot:scaffold45990_cov190-Skeletonema_marinoi.AAC.1
MPILLPKLHNIIETFHIKYLIRIDEIVTADYLYVGLFLEAGVREAISLSSTSGQDIRITFNVSVVSNA